MTTPVVASDGSTGAELSAGLVASYGFDVAGPEATDSSGRGNVGVVLGPSWTAAGRFGGALDFSGDAVIRVPTSVSLELRSAMTLSVWIRPARSQAGWRTVVARQTDAYFLTAGSEPPGFGPGSAIGRLSGSSSPRACGSYSSSG